MSRHLLLPVLTALSLSPGLSFRAGGNQALLSHADPNMADVMDSSPALLYNDTVNTATSANLALEASAKEFAKINRLLDKQILDQTVKVMGTKVHLQQALSCVSDADARLREFKVREKQARDELSKVRQESGLGTATNSTLPSNSSTSQGSGSSAAALLSLAKKPAPVSSFIDISDKASESDTLQQRHLRSTESARRVVSELDAAMQADKQTESLSETTRQSAPVHRVIAQTVRGRAVDPAVATGGTDVGSRLESVRAFLTSAAANAASRVPLPSIGSITELYIKGTSGFGGSVGRAGGVASSSGAGDTSATGGGTGGGSLGSLSSLADPTAAVKDVFRKAIDRLENWLEAVSSQTQTMRNRRDECTIHVDELTTLLQSQRGFLELLKKRKEYERKVYLAQQAEDQSLASFAGQEKEVILADLIAFNQKWNAAHSATPDLQLPPTVIPDWEEYSNTVSLAKEDPPPGVAVPGSGSSAAAAAASGGGAAVAVAVAGGNFLRRPGLRSAPRPPPANASVPAAPEVTTAAPEVTLPTSTPTPTTMLVTTVAEPNATILPTTPSVTTEILNITSVAATTTLEVVQETTPKVKPIPVDDKPLVSSEAESLGGSTPKSYNNETIAVSGVVKAWADINQTAQGSSEYSAFDVTNDLFSSN